MSTLANFLGFDKDDIDKAKKGLIAGGQELRVWGERIDTRLAKIDESNKASEIEAVRKSIKLTAAGTLAANAYMPSNFVGPTRGSHWIIRGVTARSQGLAVTGCGLFDRPDATNAKMYLSLGAFTTLISAAANPDGILIGGLTTPIPELNIAVKESQEIGFIAAGGATTVRIDVFLEIDEYTLEPKFDAVG